MPYRNQAFRLAPFFAICVFCTGLATHGVAQDDECDADCDDERESVIGVVDQLQLIDATSMGGGRQLIIRLETGEAFSFPHVDHIAAGAGVKVRIRHRDADGDDELPAACSADVLALPLESGDSLQKVGQPFEVYRNPDC